MKKKKVDQKYPLPFLFGMGNQIAPLIRTDPNGSYTGRSEDPYETPVQDADDL